MQNLINTAAKTLEVIEAAIYAALDAVEAEVEYEAVGGSARDAVSGLYIGDTSFEVEIGDFDLAFEWGYIGTKISREVDDYSGFEVVAELVAIEDGVAKFKVYQG